MEDLEGTVSILKEREFQWGKTKQNPPRLIYHLHPYCFPRRSLSHQQGMKVLCQQERFSCVYAEVVTLRHKLIKQCHKINESIKRSILIKNWT